MGFSNIISNASQRTSRLSELGLRTPFHFRADFLHTPTINWVLQNHFHHFLQILRGPAGCSPQSLLHKKLQNTEANSKGKTQNKIMQQIKQEGLLSALTKAKNSCSLRKDAAYTKQTNEPSSFFCCFTWSSFLKFVYVPLFSMALWKIPWHHLTELY